MPRLRAQSQSASLGVPADLLDLGAAAWQTEAATRRWLSAHGLRPKGWRVEELLGLGPACRHEAAVTLWAEGEGYSFHWGAENAFHRSEFGIPWSSTVRERLLRVPAAG